MTTLDNPNQSIDPSTVSVWPLAMRYGGIVGLAMIVLGLVTFLTGLSDPAKPSGAQQAISCLNYIIIMATVVLR